MQNVCNTPIISWKDSLACVSNRRIPCTESPYKKIPGDSMGKNHRKPWGFAPMENNGLYPMEFHGPCIPWKPMENTMFHGVIIPWNNTHGVPWNSMEFHGIPWISMEFHGIPWYTMVYHGKPPDENSHGIQWDPGTPWGRCSMVSHGIQISAHEARVLWHSMELHKKLLHCHRNLIV